MIMLKTITIIFMVLIPINLVGLVECKDWKKDEKYWLFALVMSILGFIVTGIRIIQG